MNWRTANNRRKLKLMKRSSQPLPWRKAGCGEHGFMLPKTWRIGKASGPLYECKQCKARGWGVAAAAPFGSVQSAAEYRRALYQLHAELISPPALDGQDFQGWPTP